MDVLVGNAEQLAAGQGDPEDGKGGEAEAWRACGGASGALARGVAGQGGGQSAMVTIQVARAPASPGKGCDRKFAVSPQRAGPTTRPWARARGT